MIQSLERGFAVLELFDRDDVSGEGLGAQEVATELGLKFPTAHNFLKSLVELGYLERVPANGKYRLSSRLGRLGNRQNRLKTLRTVAGNEIERLAERFQETVSLSLETDFQREGLVLAESTQDLRVVQRHKDSAFYPYPVGRVHLSRLSPARLEEFIAERGLPTGEWPGVGTRPELDAALERIRTDGHEVKRNHEIGAAAIAVPVPGLDDEFNAALCLVLPLLRLDEAKCQEIILALQESAQRITTAMQQ
jgi:DNA-binding IclR family transcriptional regulator